MLKSKWWALAGVLALAFFAAACGGGDDGDSSSTSGETVPVAQSTTTAVSAPTVAASQIKRGGTLVRAITANPKSFDPMLQNDVPGGEISTNVYEGLYKYDDKYQPQPWLAEKVENPDNKTYVFTMRKGVKFHDGTEMDAEAVKFSMDRIRTNDKSVGYGDARTIEDVIVVDKYTVRVNLKEPFAPFPSRLTGRLGAVVSPTAVRTLGDRFDLNPVGTGPFKFGELRNDAFVRLDKFEGYWKNGADGKPLPYLDKVEFRVITEAAARLTALQAGDVDLADLREADLPTAKADSNLLIETIPGVGYSGFFLTINKPPFDNKALRQALRYAIDAEEVNAAIFENQRAYSNGPIPAPLAWAVDPSYKPYPQKADLAKAREKLAEGGKPQGFEFEYWIPSGDATTQRYAELLQSQVAKVGIKMNIQSGDFNGVVIPKLQKQESNAYALTITGGVDPDQFIANQYGTGGSFNFYPYSNARVDELIQQGRNTVNQEERAKAYKEAVKLIMDDAPNVYIVTGVARHAGQKKVQGWFLGPKATTGFAEYWKQ